MEILIIILLTLLNGFFSLSEIALVSVKKSRLEHLVANGSSRALTVLRLLQNPENFLSSVQVGITLIGIISGAYGGAALTDDVESVLAQFSFLGAYTHLVSLIVVIGGITYFTIVVGELVPKTLAMNNAEPIALFCVPIINYFTYAVFPFVKMLSYSTKLILKLIGASDSNADHISEEELKFMLKNARKTGVLEHEESEVHQNIFHFNDRTAKSLMTHSSEVEWINSEWSTQEILNQIVISTHSKFVVSAGSIDHIQGIIRVKDFLENYNTPGFKLEDFIEPPVFISQNSPAFKTLSLFKAKKQYIGLVTDEFGSFLGIITLHDLIEGIVGDLPEEEEDVIEKILVREDGSYLVDGKTPLFDFNKFFDKELIETNNHYTTVAGFMLDQLKAIPKAGDYVTHHQFRFEVMDIDGRRIDKILVTLVKTEN